MIDGGRALVVRLFVANLLLIQPAHNMLRDEPDVADPHIDEISDFAVTKVQATDLTSLHVERVDDIGAVQKTVFDRIHGDPRDIPAVILAGSESTSYTPATKHGILKGTYREH
ncbi:hypothetical protein RRG08_006381 [Elysia crispata]|uniref:Uncharacterized protein n=1 Tax=Elysia crispata TaxID=231223 RepID=A0AAE0YBG3_9GAST|nr:hypothetical protein RRG08_006381 [Elysia crispata]